MDETEFEEGEACYYMDNSRVDPDIALSYIDEKLQNVLGHFQKDFEGGVSAENLGTKFGGYGSFLPTYQRSPSIRSHPKSSRGVQNFSSPESPNVLPVEDAPMATTQSTRLGALNKVVAPSPVFSDKNVSRLSSDQAKKCLVKKEPVLNKQVNSSDQRSLKVRIKINSDNATKNKNAIYCGFGLNTTPSSSMGNSEDSSGMPSCAGTISESPSNIIKIMTSFPVSNGALLSPIIESLLSLEMKERIPKATKKDSKENKSRVSVKKENAVISSKDIGLNLDDKTISFKPEGDVKEENMENETQCQGLGFFGDKNPNHMSGNKNDADRALQVCNLVKRNVSRKKMEATKGSTEENLSFGIKDESLESISDHSGGDFEKRVFPSSSIEKISGNKSKNYCKDESVDVVRNVQSRRNENYSMSIADSDVSNCSRDVRDEVKMTNGVEISHSKGKKKSKKIQNSVDSVSEPERSLISGSLEVSRRKKNSAEVHNVKSQDDIKMVNSKGTQPKTAETLLKSRIRDLPEGSLSKSSRGVVEKKQGLSFNTLRETSTQKDSKARLVSDSSFKESANDSGLPHQAGHSVVEPNIAEPVVIEEDWVQCDRCEKWRLLPYGTNAQQLPEKWVCRMLNWLPGMNRCDISEDDTTQALHRLYQTESQTNLANHVDRNVPGALSADVEELKNRSNYTLSSTKIKPKLKETRAESNGGSVQISGSVKNFQQDVVKSRSLNDMNLNLSEEKNTHRQKMKHEKSGESEKKFKGKRAADHYDYGTPKRSKVDVASGVVKFTKKVPSSGIVEGDLTKPGFSEIKTYDEREISLKKRKLKDWQESQNCVGISKDDGNHPSEPCNNEFKKIKNSAIFNVAENESILRKSDEKPRRIDQATKLKNLVNSREEAFNLDLGSEQFLKPATSSSSKVSNSLKSRSHFLEVKGSPVESVSSSPFRNLNLDQLSPSRRGNSRKTALNNGQTHMVDSAKKPLSVESNTQIHQSVSVKKAKVPGISYSESPGFPPLDFRDNNKSQKLGSKSKARDESPDHCRNVHLVKNESEVLESLCHSDDKSNKTLNNRALVREKSRKGSSLSSKGKDESLGNNPEKIKVSIRPSEIVANPKESLRDNRDLKCRIKLVKDNRDDKLTRETPRIQGFNNSGVMKSDAIQKSSSSQVVSNPVVMKDPPAQFPPSSSGSHKGNAYDVVPADPSCCVDLLKVPKQCTKSLSPIRNDASSRSNVAFEEAENSKAYGDRLKNSGFSAEANEAHFNAVLHFLHAASLRESCNYSCNKHGEMSPMQIYSSTAKLSKLCAIEYEKRNDLANAALSYKCMEVAYFRVVYCKNSTMTRDRHDLQAALQIVPQGESPSSSASDVDSLNNQVMVDSNKSALSKNVGSHAGNHIIVARNRSNFVRLLDFMKDVDSAMEASNKTQNTFAAASHKAGENNTEIVSVKKVTDLSFQDVEELIRLARIANDLISRQGFSGNKV